MPLPVRFYAQGDIATRLCVASDCLLIASDLSMTQARGKLLYICVNGSVLRRESSHAYGDQIRSIAMLRSRVNVHERSRTYLEAPSHRSDDCVPFHPVPGADRAGLLRTASANVECERPGRGSVVPT